MYDIENLYEPESLEEAFNLLEKHPQSRIIAGGSDILIKIRGGKLVGANLVSLRKIDSLRGITLNGEGALVIGALSTFSQIIKNPLLQKNLKVLCLAAASVGGPQIRNIGTIGGNIANGAPSADGAPALFACDALLEYSNKNGKRLIPLKEHYISAGGTALKHGEVITSIIIPEKSYKNYNGHYIKYASRNAMDIAAVSCALNIKLSADKKVIEDCRCAFGSAAPVPVRARAFEAAVCGETFGGQTLEKALPLIEKDINPRTSFRAEREFRLHIAKEIAKRAFFAAAQSARPL